MPVELAAKYIRHLYIQLSFYLLITEVKYIHYEWSFDSYIRIGVPPSHLSRSGLERVGSTTTRSKSRKSICTAGN